MMGLGRDTSGAPVVMDLTKAPHLLIAGATGSGKSVSINAILTSLLMQHGPESLQLVLVDPKMVELPSYNGIPHLIGKVITDMEQVMGALTWLLLQMDDRYRLFREAGARNISAYNEMARKQQKKGDLKPLPYIVLVVDELADLMMTAAEDIERQICRLAQMSRATGIHLILATQRPSTDVVTGVIKANFPSRIAFAVTSQIDSRVILDQPGAERLLGQGDMLLMRPDAAKLFRLQGCYVSDEEIDGVVSFWRRAGRARRRRLRSRRGTVSWTAWTTKMSCLLGRHRPAARHEHLQHEHAAAQAAPRLSQGRAPHGAARSRRRRRPRHGRRTRSRSPAQRRRERRRLRRRTRSGRRRRSLLAASAHFRNEIAQVARPGLSDRAGHTVYLAALSAGAKRG